MPRLHFTLTDKELNALSRLKDEPGLAFRFWAGIAEKYGLDYKTILSENGRFSGLPIGHKEHWCYPIELRCRFNPHKGQKAWETVL